MAVSPGGGLLLTRSSPASDLRDGGCLRATYSGSFTSKKTLTAKPESSYSGRYRLVLERAMRLEPIKSRAARMHEQREALRMQTNTQNPVLRLRIHGARGTSLRRLPSVL